MNQGVRLPIAVGFMPCRARPPQPPEGATRPCARRWQQRHARESGMEEGSGPDGAGQAMGQQRPRALRDPKDGEPRIDQAPCRDCHGTGLKEDRPCPICGGTGRVAQIAGEV